MSPLLVTACLLASYLFGSVSWAWLLVQWCRGEDLRKVGSGNLGATNASRVLGRRWGLLIYALDMLKGLLPAVVGRFALEDPGVYGTPVPLGLAMGIAAFCGHCFPVWFGFRGGKGVATASGALLAVAPAATGIAILAFSVVLSVTRMISAGSLAAAVTLPAAFWWTQAAGAPSWSSAPRVTFVLVLLLALAVVWLHRSNARRILAGTESRIGRPRPGREEGRA